LLKVVWFGLVMVDVICLDDGGNKETELQDKTLMLEGLTQTGDSAKMGMPRNSGGRSSCCTRASLESALR
jgi:hypothetical protein